MSKHIGARCLLALLVGAVLFAAGCGSTGQTGANSGSTAASASTAPSGEPIVIGAVVSTTGAAAPLGEPERNAMQLLEKTINASGGVLGRPIKIVIEDDQTNPKEAVTAVNKLLQQDKVVAVMGGSTSAHVGHQADNRAGRHPLDGARGVERHHAPRPSRGPGGRHRATLSLCRMP